MPPKKKSTQPESGLLLAKHPDVTDATPVIDTHCHLASTFEWYRNKYKEDAERQTLRQFVADFLVSRAVTGCVDVWCEPPQPSLWRDVVEDASTWPDFDYRMVCGLHPHEAKHYTDEVEAQLLEQLAHPRNVGFGEIGLDYHYDSSPRDVQQEVLARQLRLAVKLNKPLTIHTREADADIERILKAEVPSHWKIHVHCFTDTLELAEALLSHFPNLVIGITGVTTFGTNHNTPAVIRRLAERAAQGKAEGSVLHSLRLVLETDSPYMTPTNLPMEQFGMKKNARLALNHAGTIPWTAEFTAAEASKAGREWATAEIIMASRENAKAVYGI